MKQKYIFILMASLLCNIALSQSSSAFEKMRDSLMALPNDSVKVEALMVFCSDSLDVDFTGSMQVAQVALDLATNLKLFKRKARFYNRIGDAYFNKANYGESFRCYYSAYKLSDSINSKYNLAMSAYNLGWQSAIQQKTHKDVSYLYKALKIGEEIESNSIILRAQNALGSFYTDKFEGDHQRNDFDSAIKYFTKAIEITKHLKRYGQAAALYVNMGQLFYHAKDYQSAKFYYEKGNNMFASDSNSIVSTIHKIAMCNEGLKKADLAYPKYKFVYEYAVKNDLIEVKKEVLFSLFNYYESNKDYKKAYEAHKEYVEILSATNKELNSISINNLETNYNYMKSEAINTQLKQANEIQELKDKRKTFYIFLLIGIGLVIVVVAYLLFKQSKLRQSINLRLVEQNKIITEKKLEIEQSIEYAKGIQTVFLPEKEVLRNCFKESFVFYKPKDVVSGDFYWFNEIKNKQEILIASADCTGHGVPGALMSMVGINTLHQLSFEKGIYQPGELLKQLNNGIKNSLKQNTDHTKQYDGMDIALIKVDIKKMNLIFSGANRPLYLVRNNVVAEYKATKHAIGGFTKYNQIFHEEEIKLLPGDFVCMTTDGFADQFGGEGGKKFMTKNLKRLLAEIAQLPSDKRLPELEKVFDTWRGRHNQVDDICVIGFSV